MTRRIGWMIAIAALVVVPLRAPAADPTPTMVLRIRPLETILEDVKYLAEMVGQKDAFALFEGQIAQLPGIDFKKPLGAYAYVSPGIVDSGFAVMVPVKSEKEILDLLGSFGMNPDKDNDGVYTLSLPPPVPFPAHFRFANGYMYVTIRDKSALSKDSMIPPAKVFAGPQTQLADLSIRLDKIPDQVRQLVVTQMELALPQILESQKSPNESEAQTKGRIEGAKAGVAVVSSLVKDGREIRLQLDLNRKTHTAALQFSVDGAANSDLAKYIAAMGKIQSPFAGLHTGSAALNLGANLSLPDGIAKLLGAVFEEEMQRAAGLEPNATKKAALVRWMKSLAPTLSAGRLQFAGTLRGPSASGKFTAVAGLRVQGGMEIENALRNLAKVEERPLSDLLRFDHFKVGTIGVHQLTPIKQGLDPAYLKLFGTAPVYWTVTPDALYAAVGENAPDAIKEALALKPVQASVLHAEGSVAGLLALLDDAGGKKALEAAKNAFRGVDLGADRIRITVEGGESLKFRIEARTQLLKFFAAMAGISP